MLTPNQYNTCSGLKRFKHSSILGDGYGSYPFDGLTFGRHRLSGCRFSCEQRLRSKAIPYFHKALSFFFSRISKICSDISSRRHKANLEGVLVQGCDSMFSSDVQFAGIPYIV